MNKTKRTILKGVFLGIAAIIPAVITTHCATRTSVENRSLVELSHFESVTVNMTFGQAMEAISEEADRLRRTVSTLESQQITETMQNTERLMDYQYQISNLEADITRLVSEIHLAEEQTSVIGQNHEESLEQIIYYRNQIRELEEEISNLRSEIDIFLARGETPVPRNPDGRPATIIRLADLTTIQDSFLNSDMHQDNYQHVYTDVMTLRRRHTFRALLDGRYTRLTGVIFIAYGETNNRTTTIRFEREGELPISHRMDRTSRPIEIDINLEGVNEFSIVRHDDAGFSPNVYYAYFRLYP